MGAGDDRNTPPVDGAESADRPGRDSKAAHRSATRWIMLLGACLVVFVLVVVVGIKWSREHSVTSECRRSFELLGKAAEQYAEKHGGKYPYEPRAMEYMLVNNLRHRKFLVCPKNKRTYHWTRHERSRTDPPYTLLAWEDPALGPHGLVFKGYHVLFVGARVEVLSREELERRLREEFKSPPTPYRHPKRRKPGLTGRPGERLPGYPPKLPPDIRLHPSSKPPEELNTGKKKPEPVPDKEKPETAPRPGN